MIPVTRLLDIPFWTSPPLQFTFSQTAEIEAGQYNFEGAGQEMVGNKNINDNTLILINTMSFSASIPREVYQEALALTTLPNTFIPNFNMFLESGRNAPVLRDPVELNDYFVSQVFTQLIDPKVTPNRLSAFFRGTLQQTAALAGISEITLNIQIFCQEITDDNFIQAVKKGYPDLGNVRRNH